MTIPSTMAARCVNYSGDFKQAFENGGFDGLMDRVKVVQAKVSAELQGGGAAGSPKSVE
jgi:hypothetical protein